MTNLKMHRLPNKNESVQYKAALAVTGVINVNKSVYIASHTLLPINQSFYLICFCYNFFEEANMFEIKSRRLRSQL